MYFYGVPIILSSLLEWWELGNFDIADRVGRVMGESQDKEEKVYIMCIIDITDIIHSLYINRYLDLAGCTIDY